MPFGEHADEDGIIEVARGFSVDGDDGQIAKVAATLQFARGMIGSESPALLQDVGGKTVGQMKFADHDFDVDAEIVFAAKYLD